MLFISAGIGIYFGCIKGGQNTIFGYLFGSKELSVFPITVSLITGNISCVTLLGAPTEMYTYGTLSIIQIFAITTATLISIYMIIPMFYNLQLISVFEYMEMRFGKTMRKTISAISTLTQIGYLPLVLYGPALALNQMTGANIHVLSVTVCVICIFYTTLGGLKAVVWSDTIQSIFMVVSILTVFFLGIRHEGGISNIWESSIKGDRIEFFTSDWDLTTRISIWYFLLSQFGLYLYKTGYDAPSLQRYTSLKTLKEAQIACAGMMIGYTFFVFLSAVIGLVLYAAYQDCDPLSAKMISKPDQLLPLYVLKFSKTMPGLPAVFACGIVSAALSTLSTCLNTFSGVIYEDFVVCWFNEQPSERMSSAIMKLILVVLAVISLLLVLVVEKMGTVIEVTMLLSGGVTGVTLGSFFMGSFLPWVNKKGAYVGVPTGLATMCWLGMGTYLARSAGKIRYNTKPMSVSGCNLNETLPALLNSSIQPESNVFFPFRISTFNHIFIGFLATVCVGLIVSFTTGANNLSKINPDLIVPIIRRKLDLKKSNEIVVQCQSLLNHRQAAPKVAALTLVEC